MTSAISAVSSFPNLFASGGSHHRLDRQQAAQGTRRSPSSHLASRGLRNAGKTSLQRGMEDQTVRREIEAALKTNLHAEVVGNECLPSCFAVSDLLSASVAAVGSAASTLVATLGLAPSPPPVRVDQRLVSLWSGRSIHPIGWELPPTWDTVAGDYRTRDGWIKLHTNLPHHRHA